MPTQFPTQYNFIKSRALGKEQHLNKGRGGMCVKGGTGKPEATLPACSPDLHFPVICNSINYLTDDSCEVSHPDVTNWTDTFPGASQGCCWLRFVIDVTDTDDCECDERDICKCKSMSALIHRGATDPIPNYCDATC